MVVSVSLPLSLLHRFLSSVLRFFELSSVKATISSFTAEAIFEVCSKTVNSSRHASVSPSKFYSVFWRIFFPLPIVTIGRLLSLLSVVHRCSCLSSSISELSSRSLTDTQVERSIFLQGSKSNNLVHSFVSCASLQSNLRRCAYELGG